jgi:hypothetical protein
VQYYLAREAFTTARDLVERVMRVTIAVTIVPRAASRIDTL